MKHRTWLRLLVLRHLMVEMISAAQLAAQYKLWRESVSRSLNEMAVVGYVQCIGRLYVITAEGIDYVMKATQVGDYEAWQRWLGFCGYAQAHTDRKFYNQFQKLLHAVHAKAEADISLIRWTMTGFQEFGSFAQVHLDIFGSEVEYIVGRNDCGIVAELREFLLQEYRRIFIEYMKPITLQEQLQTWYALPLDQYAALDGSIITIQEIPQEKEDRS